MSTQTLTRPVGGGTVPPRRTVPQISWRSMGHDFAYLVPGFFLTLVGFIILVPLFSLGTATLVIWIGAPILGFMLLAASGIARENRELMRRWGDDVAEPHYRQPAPGVARRLITTIADPQTWKDLLHATLVAFPLRITTFVVSVAWVASALGSLTWWVWGRFLPEGGYQGMTWLYETVTGTDLGGNWYVTESVLYLIAGAVLLLLAPVVVRLCCRVDAVLARALLGGGTW